MAQRDAILEGAQAAHRLHAELSTRASIERDGLACVDVFGAAMHLGAVLLFRRLDGLLGAFIPNAVQPGIIISTQRNLHVQRFTAAHELGHLLLKHELSLDEDVGLWRGASYNHREVAADSFASEFLLPRWLYVRHAARQRWESTSLERADVVYQLSLRLGASYDATCYGLQGHKILPRPSVAKLRKALPKKLKLTALAGRAELTDPWADVWTITTADHGMRFQGGPNDIVIFKIPERASAGYLWDESQLRGIGLEVLADDRQDGEQDDSGAPVTRVLVTRITESREYRVSFTERRPWHPDDTAATLTVSLDMQGKEDGLPRIARKAIAAA